MRVLCLVLLGLLPLNAAGYTGGQLLNFCSGKTTDGRADEISGVLGMGTCQSFILGFEAGRQAEFMNSYVWAAEGKGTQKAEQLMAMMETMGVYCLPNSVTLNQQIAVFTKYGNEHPEEWHEPAAFLLIRSMRLAFPCKPKPE